MKKEEIKLSLISLVGGLGILFCVYYFDIPFLPGSKYHYDEPYVYRANGENYPLPNSESKLPVASYRGTVNSRSNNKSKLMTAPISATTTEINYRSSNGGYHFNETETSTGSNAPLFSQNNLSKPSTATGGSGGGISGFYAYTGKGSSERNNASGQSSRSSMLTTSELGEPFTNYSPTGPKKVYAYTPNSGGTDPGGDPTGPPIPVGEGWGVLLLLAAGYASFIKLRAKK